KCDDNDLKNANKTIVSDISSESCREVGFSNTETASHPAVEETTSLVCDSSSSNKLVVNKNVKIDAKNLKMLEVRLERCTNLTKNLCNESSDKDVNTKCSDRVMTTALKTDAHELDRAPVPIVGPQSNHCKETLIVENKVCTSDASIDYQMDVDIHTDIHLNGRFKKETIVESSEAKLSVKPESICLSNSSHKSKLDRSITDKNVECKSIEINSNPAKISNEVAGIKNDKVIICEGENMVPGIKIQQSVDKLSLDLKPCPEKSCIRSVDADKVVSCKRKKPMKPDSPDELEDKSEVLINDDAASNETTLKEIMDEIVTKVESIVNAPSSIDSHRKRCKSFDDNTQIDCLPSKKLKQSDQTLSIGESIHGNNVFEVVQSGGQLCDEMLDDKKAAAESRNLFELFNKSKIKIAKVDPSKINEAIKLRDERLKNMQLMEKPSPVERKDHEYAMCEKNNDLHINNFSKNGLSKVIKLDQTDIAADITNQDNCSDKEVSVKEKHSNIAAKAITEIQDKIKTDAILKDNSTASKVC
ncbi:Uncharacterised protein PB.4031, partial [Pycnogonum litorale]